MNEKKYAWGHSLGQSCKVCRYSTNQTKLKEIKGDRWFCLRSPNQLEVYEQYWCGEWQPVFTHDKLQPTES